MNGLERAVGRDHGRLPGSSAWLYAKVYSRPDDVADVLKRVPALLATWRVPPTWWYVPYRDPEHHLRLRFRLPSSRSFGAALQRLSAWSSELRDLGLLNRIQIDTYYPETGRYGFDTAMDAAERFFAADSTAALTQLDAASSGMPPAAFTAASMVDLAVSFFDDTTEGMQWLRDRVSRDSTPVDGGLRRVALALADPDDDWANLRQAAGGPAVVAAWQSRRDALSSYRLSLSTQRDAVSVLPSLLHMHHVRMLGTQPGLEARSRRLVRAAALRWLNTRQPDDVGQRA